MTRHRTRQAPPSGGAELAARFGLRLIREALPAELLPQQRRETSLTMRTPHDVWRLSSPRYEPELVEVFAVILLDSQQRATEFVEISRGTLNASLVHPRELFRLAIVAGAASIILVHNHPSGDPTPSMEDRIVTDQLLAAGELIGISVRDHVIIGRGRYVSFVESGLLTNHDRRPQW